MLMWTLALGETGEQSMCVVWLGWKWLGGFHWIILGCLYIPLNSFKMKGTRQHPSADTPFHHLLLQYISYILPCGFTCVDTSESNKFLSPKFTLRLTTTNYPQQAALVLILQVDLRSVSPYVWHTSSSLLILLDVGTEKTKIKTNNI